MNGIALLLVLVATTGALFGVVAITGARGKRQLHFGCLAVALPVFALTVLVADGVGRTLVFDDLAFRVHMVFAHASFGVALVAIATGFLRVWRDSWRPAHRLSVAGFLVVLVGAVVTGAWMLSTGASRETEEAPPAREELTEVTRAYPDSMVLPGVLREQGTSQSAVGSEER